MIRTLFWLIIWVLTLGIADIQVEYDDGLNIKFIGWANKLGKKK